MDMKKSTPITQDAIQEPNLGNHLRYGNLRVVRLQSVVGGVGKNRTSKLIVGLLLYITLYRANHLNDV